jgi:predicted RNA binding protein YcfA (HicA-like mRNA interferase family)
LKTRDLIRVLGRLARKRGIDFRYDARNGKGSHGRIFFAGRFTTVPGIGKDIGIGLLTAILRDLCLKRADLE